MLDNNTNKVIWVGVAVGVVAVVGAGALLLFPQITDAFKPMMRESMLVTQATPNTAASGPEGHLTYANNYVKFWDAYYFYLNKKPLEVKPHTYVYYGLDVHVDKDSLLFIDISNDNPNDKGSYNDNDDENYRKFSVLDSDGNEMVVNSNGESHLKADKLYHIMIKYRNSSDDTIYDKPLAIDNGVVTAGSVYGSGLAFRPNDGAKPGNDLHVSVSNYKVNMVHF